MRKLDPVDPGLRESDAAVRETFFLEQHEKIKEVIEGRIQQPRVVHSFVNGKQVMTAEKGNVDSVPVPITFEKEGRDYPIRHGLNRDPVMWRVIDLRTDDPDAYPIIKQGPTRNTMDILYLRCNAPNTTAVIEVW